MVVVGGEFGQDSRIGRIYRRGDLDLRWPEDGLVAVGTTLQHSLLWMADGQGEFWRLRRKGDDADKSVHAPLVGSGAKGEGDG